MRLRVLDQNGPCLNGGMQPFVRIDCDRARPFDHGDKVHHGPAAHQGAARAFRKACDVLQPVNDLLFDLRGAGVAASKIGVLHCSKEIALGPGNVAGIHLPSP
jgi:hypothetical protein